MGRSIWLFCYLIMLISRHWPFSILLPLNLYWSTTWMVKIICSLWILSSCSPVRITILMVFHWYICWHVIILGFYTEQNIFNPVWHHTTQLHLLFQIHHYNNVRLGRRTLHNRKRNLLQFFTNSFFTSFIFPSLEHSFHDGGAHHS